MKNVPCGRISPNDLRLQAANFGSPGCVEGFGASSSDGSTYFGFVPIAIPLNKIDISSQNFEAINASTMDALNVSPFPVVIDASPENMGFIPSGPPLTNKPQNNPNIIKIITQTKKNNRYI